MKDTALSSGQIERIAGFQLFDGMEPALVGELLARVNGAVRTFAKDETVVLEGVVARWVVLVLRGRLGVFEAGARGAMHHVRVVEAGALFGATLVTGNLGSYPGMATATVPSEVVFLQIDRIKPLWCEKRYVRFFENLYTLVSAEVLACWRRMSILSCKKVDDRFMMYLRWRASEMGTVDLQLPFSTSETCANYLGVTRTALSLAIKRLVAHGEIIHPARGRFVLVC